MSILLCNQPAIIVAWAKFLETVINMEVHIFNTLSLLCVSVLYSIVWFIHMFELHLWLSLIHILMIVQR